MKKVLNHVKSRVLSGVIFLIPLFATILIIQKFGKGLSAPKT
jgi:uncharacterized membrane protein